jgi:hypothetical protein
VASDRLHFEHEDGAPFFWLGDTWWMGLCKRLCWPEDFQTLVTDRVKKGFTVIQIVAGLYPDMPAFDPRGENEAGYAWEAKFARINPHYFDMADLRIQYLVDHGLMPCIVGFWGFLFQLMGVAKAKQQWRYIIARWGAYPVVWCLAGEAAKRGWPELGRYVRSIDAFHHPVTIHDNNPRDAVEDPTLLDFDMLLVGHEDVWNIPDTINLVTRELLRAPRMPVLVGEVAYEGHKQQNRQQVVRFMFWSCMLSGAGGHTYGAGGVWEVQTRAHPYGPSPWGGGYGDLPWDIAYQYPGSQQLGWGKELLMRYEWWRLEPHPEWVEPHWSKGDYENYMLPYAAGIPGELRIVFIPLRHPRVDYSVLPKIVNLEPDVTYEAFWFHPATAKEYPIGKVTPDANGTWKLARTVDTDLIDWVVVLENQETRRAKTSNQLGGSKVGGVSCDRPNVLGW